MPIYDYKCPSCGRQSNDVFVHRHDAVVECTQCHATMSKLFPNSVRFMTADVFPPEGVHLEHVSPEGKTFHSKKEMRKYEKTHNVELGYLL